MKMTFLDLEIRSHGGQHPRPVARPVAEQRGPDSDFGSILKLENRRHGGQHPRPVARPVAGHRSPDLDFGSIFRTKLQSVAKARSGALTASILVQGVLIAAAVLSSVLLADSLPDPKAVRAFLVGPMHFATPPPPPPAPAAPRLVAQAQPKPRPAEPNKFVAPLEVPNENPVEEGIDLGTWGDIGIEDWAAGGPGGLPGGVEGGVPGGVVGAIVGGIPQPPPPPPPVLWVGGHISEPEIVHDVKPEYPLLARAVNHAAIVITKLRVDVRGYVKIVEVLRGDPLFNDAVVEALKQRRYRPLLLNGQPHEFIITVVVKFGQFQANA